MALPFGDGWTWYDAWRELGGEEKNGWTMDSGVCPLAGNSYLRPGVVFQRRFDRVLVRNAGVRSMMRVGDEDVEGVWCSDHFGLVVDVVVDDLV